jgi:4-amino-4-deoxy-L-arabinose transferase-like glycosyltransferase
MRAIPWDMKTYMARLAAIRIIAIKPVHLSLIVIGVWFLFCLATLNYNGPFIDEGTYVTAGQRALEGHGATDGYLKWFNGSLLWPVMAAVGYKVAGLVGTRMVALVLATVAFAAFMRATKNLFGAQASFWATTVLAISGPFLFVARLGVYDAAALAGLAVSVWAITQLERWDDRTWLAAAAIAFTLGVFIKYPVGLMLLPLVGLIIALRRKKSTTDLAIFGFISSAMALAFFLPMREQLVSFVHWNLENQPTFGVTRVMIGFDILYLSAIPSLLALAGWFVAGQKRGAASVLVLSLAIWPAYHLLTGHSASRDKHLVMGYLFAYALVGLALSALWGAAKPASFEGIRGTWRSIADQRIARRGLVVIIILTLGVIGRVQMNQTDQAWPDTRQAADYLLDQVRPGERLLINASWPYIIYLYTEGRIDSPWAVYDVYRITHGQSEIDLCEYDWFVDAEMFPKWPKSVVTAIQRCGHFEQAFVTTSTVTGLSPSLKYERNLVRTVVWRNGLKGLGDE